MSEPYREPYLPYAGNNIWDGRSIEASNQTLLRQAPMTAYEYLLSAIDHIDQKLGKGYAKQHPELIGAFMQASAIDLGTAMIARAIESLSTIGANLDRIADTLSEREEERSSDEQ
jgi:hypothetical protein